MRTFVLILAMLATPLAAQDKQIHKTEPPQISAQPESKQASQTEAQLSAQQPQTVVTPTTKTAQPPPTHQLITFTAEQLDEYENKILDRSEAFYNNRMNHLLWTMGIIMAAGLAIVGILIPVILEFQRKRSFAKEMANRLQEFKKYAKKQTQEVETKLISHIDDREAEQTKAITSNLSMIFMEIGALFLTQKEWSGMLLSYAFAIKRSVSGQCIRSCLNTCKIKRILENPDIAKKIALDSLQSVDEALEDVKKYLDEIADTEERADVESQVKDLQISVHALIKEKQQAAKTTPPQTEPQQT
jgi:hypothetical protein